MSLRSKVYLIIERLLSKCTDNIVCISKAEKQSAIREAISSEDKLVLIPNGICIDKVRNAVGKRRGELGVAEDTFVVGMIGRLTPQKAPDIFIRAAELIKSEIPNSAYIIVGDGEQREETEAYAKEHGISLLVTGWTDEPYAYLKVFDVALLLSRWEGFGLAIVEYMAAEKNVVASKVDAIPTLVDDGVDGLLVEVDNPKDVAEKVLYLYRHPEEARKMRDVALEKVINNYDISRVVKQHEEMFMKLVSMKTDE